MCTAINLNGVFGRTFDYERSFGEEIIVTPREKVVYGQAKNRYAMLGVGVVRGESTLYFDGINEWGLCGAALNFPHYAVYQDHNDKKASITPGSLLGFLLGFCKDTHEVRGALENVAIVSDVEDTPLHWMFADSRGSITVESVEEGLKIYENPLGVLTNSPPFTHQMAHLSSYLHLSAKNSKDNLTEGLVKPISRGVGAVGLPGDFSSPSRFVRAAFVKENALNYKTGCCNKKANSEEEEIDKFFHLASSVSIPLGCVVTDEGYPVSTRYVACADRENLTYYFSSYGCRQRCSVRLSDELRDSESIKIFPLYQEENIKKMN